jgi:Coenzyme PQQ synthesis protein D (PqqD)
MTVWHPHMSVHPETEDVMFRVPEHVRNTSSEDGGIVLDMTQGRLYGLNVMGSKILTMAEQGFEPAQIAQEIAQTFQVDRDLVEQDVREFLATLQNRRLLESETSTPLPACKG